MAEIKISFPGKEKVNAHFLDFKVPTDQRKEHGGEQSAPNPFDYFFVSLATCAGSSAMGFCKKHDLPTEGLEVALETIRHETESRIAKVVLKLQLPSGFPSDKIEGLRKSASNCTVKRHITTPPEFETIILPTNG